MTFISALLSDLERSSPGSEETAQQVISMLGGISPKKALFVGDEITTPLLIEKSFGCSLRCAFMDELRMKQGAAAGLDSSVVQLFELPGDEGEYDLIWYNGIVDFDGCAQRLEQLGEKLKKGGVVVYRAVSWLTEPSPDAKLFCERRYGKILPLDKVLVLAKENGWKTLDFYIAPKGDWQKGYYEPLAAAAEKYAGIHKDDSGVSLGMSELRKEHGIFEAHCEEYSVVYYILKG